MIDRLEKAHTIAIVTHNMQHTARVSDDTALLSASDNLWRWSRDDHFHSNQEQTLTHRSPV